MLGEASHYGLQLEKSKVDRYLYANEKNSEYDPPNVFTKHHNSFIEEYGYVFDLIPRRRLKVVSNSKRKYHLSFTKLNDWLSGSIIKYRVEIIEPHDNDKKFKNISYLDWAYAPKRTIPNNSLLHHTVLEKIRHKSFNQTYEPNNINIQELDKYIPIEDKEIVYY